ncbi:MAG: GYD domain-containing protein [Hyphomicrobiales bacterium]
MPHYMLQGRYSPSSIKAMIVNPQDREAAARKVVEAVGGKLLGFYFAFGEDDFVAIFEAPDDTAAAALSMTVGATGGFSGGRITKLLTPKESVAAMNAAKAAVGKYSAPA